MWLYLLKANIAIALFLGIYRWLYRNDTFFGLRRYVLLLMLVTAFLYPLIDLSLWIKQHDVLSQMAQTYTSIAPHFVVAPSQKALPLQMEWPTVLSYLYGVVAVILLGRLAKQLWLIVQQRRHCCPFWIKNRKVYQLQGHETPHSFFRWIFLSPTTHSDAELNEIVEHEWVHTSRYHTLDVLVGELLTALCWVNPFAWMFKKEIRKNLEFIADNEVIDRGYDARLYQYHLVGMAQQPSAMAICNNINESPLKERIIMLNKRRSKKMKLAAYTLLLPVAVTFVLANSATLVAAGTETVIATLSSVAKEATREVPAPPQKTRKVLTLAERMPVFPGGEQALLRFIATNTKYPVKAKDAGAEGRGICNFIVETDGSITEVEVIKGIHPELDTEAVRVLKSMPKWTPGEHKGEKVAVKYTVPIVFALSKFPTPPPSKQDKKEGAQKTN